MSTAAITIDVNARLASLESGMRRTQQVVEQSAGKIESSFGRANAAVSAVTRGVVALGGAVALGQLAQQAVQVADGYTRVESQLRLVVGTSQRAAETQEQLFAVAQRSRASFVELAGTYGTIARAGADLGLSQQRLLGITEAIGQAIQLSGTSAESAADGLRQLAQGLSAGVLRGDELNSVIEQMPRLARAIADGVGVGVGQLKQLGEQGRLTADVVISALERVAPALRKEFESLTPTVGDAFTVLGNSAGRLVDRINDATGATVLLARAITGISRALDSLSDRPVLGEQMQQAQQLLARRQYEAQTFGGAFGSAGRLQDAQRAAQDERSRSLRAVREMDSSADREAASAAEAQAKRTGAAWDALNEKYRTAAEKNKALAAEIRAAGQAAGRSEAEISRMIAAATGGGRAGGGAARGGSGGRMEPPVIFDVLDAIDARARQLQDELDRRPPVNMDVLDALDARAAAQAQRLADLRERYADLLDPLEQYRQKLRDLAELEALGASVGDARSKVLEDMAAAAEQVDPALQSAIAAANQFGFTMSSAFESAIVNGARFEDVIASIARDLVQLTVRTAITQPLSNALASVVGSAVGAMFGGSGLTVDTAGQGINPGGVNLRAIGARANGGPVAGGYPYLVGERGPEIVVPRSSGTVIPNEALSPQVTVQVINQSSQPVNASAQQMRFDGARWVQQVVLTDLRRGGPIRQSLARGA